MKSSSEKNQGYGRSLFRVLKIYHRPVLRYWLLQIPETLVLALILFMLHRYEIINAALGALLLLAWIIKDALLYPYVRAAYEDAPYGRSALIGSPAVAEQDLDPSGFIRVRGELWKAESETGEDISRGSPVQITGHDGSRMFVRVREEEAPAS